MKKIKSLLLNACAYTVLLLTAFFVFATVGIGEGALMSFPSFFVLFIIGCIISASGLIFMIEKIGYPVRVIIHFFILLGAFFWILSTMGHLADKAPSAYIVIVFAFAFIYAAVSLAAYFIKKWAVSLGKKVDKKLEVRKKHSDNKKTEDKPLYK